MTPQQVAEQIKTKLKARRIGDDASNDFVFNENAVKITQAIDQVALTRLNFPACLIRIGSATADPENPTLLEQTFDIVVITQVEGDSEGERVLLGSNITSGKAPGQGLLDLEKDVIAVIRRMIRSTDGVRVIAYHTGDIEAIEVERGGGRINARTYTITAIVTDTESSA